MSKFNVSLVIYLVVILSVGIWMYSVSGLVLILGITLAYLGFILWMSLRIGQNFFVDAIHQNEGSEVVLTFDDGPHPEHTPKILDILDQFNVKAVFFLIGKNVLAYPSVAKQIVDRGHQVGGHSQNHEYRFGFTVGKELKLEIQDSIDAIKEVTGKETNLFRPPFGVTNPNIASALKGLRLQTIGWNVRSYDTATINGDVLINRVITQVKPGSIILLHDRLPQTAEILADIITKIQGKGFAIGKLKTNAHV